MAKLTRAEVMNKLVEDAEGYDDYDGKDEWRDEKRHRGGNNSKLKSFRESKQIPKGGKDKRRAYNIQRAIRRGDYDFGVSEDKTKNTNNPNIYEDDYDD